MSSKSTAYGKAVEYLMFEHDRLSGKPILEDGHLVMRSSFLIDGINCHPATFDMECKETNALYHKNNTYDEIKSHHYILSFDPKDSAEGKLTIQQAQTLGVKYAKKNFPGHQTIICTHEDGESHSGNIHVHIVLNSVRKEDVERQDYMERPCDSKAGYKHHVTRDYLKYLKLDLMQTCEKQHLHQVDLLKKSRNRRLTDKKYFAQMRSAVILSEAKNLHSRSGKHSDSQHTTVHAERPSVLAQLEQYQAELENRKSRKTRINELKHSAQSLAYLQENGYESFAALEEAYKEAKAETRAVRAQTKSISAEIDKLNEQLHHTGRYLTHRKTYNQFLKSKNKAKFRKDYSLAIAEYETSRKWLTSHAQDGTLPTSAYIDTEPGKFPNIKKVKELRCFSYPILTEN